MYKVALSSCGKEINEALFEQYRQAGIAAMEIALKPEQYPDFDYAKAKELADAAGVQLWSIHLPFYPFEAVHKIFLFFFSSVLFLSGCFELRSHNFFISSTAAFLF